MFRIVRGNRNSSFMQYDESIGHLLVDSLRHLGGTDSSNLADRIINRMRRERSLGFALFEMRVSGRDRRLVYDAVQQYRVKLDFQLKAMCFIDRAYAREHLIH